MFIETEMFDSPDLNPLMFYLSGWMKSRVSKNERWILLARIWMLLTAQRNVKFNSDEHHATFAHALPSALRFTVGFWNIHLNCNRLIISKLQTLKLN